MFFSKRRKKQREQRRQRGQFKKNPFKTVKEILLDPKPVGELVCTEEELDGHLKQTYGDM